jgi:hypothetical protein
MMFYFLLNHVGWGGNVNERLKAQLALHDAKVISLPQFHHAKKLDCG